MAIPAILKGDDSGDVTITLADGHNYEGATLVVVFNGVTREFANLTAGGEVSLAFTADETAGMPLGTGLVLMRLIGPTGAVETVGNADARIKVTDCVAEVNAGGSFAVTPGSNPLDGVEGLGTRYTGDQLRAKINEVIAKLGGTVAALLLCALPCLGGVTVQTAPLGGIYSDEPVVTNVIVDVSDKADAANVYTKAETDAKIVELAPTPGDYANVSNRAMSAIQEHQSLWPAVAASTNYTDAALGAFASTGAVARATVYGTPTRWTDATGCVWDVVTNVWFDHRDGNIFVNGVSIFPSDTTAGDMKGYLYYDPSAMEFVGETGGGWYHNGENTSGTPSVLAGGPDATSLDSGNLTLGNLTNLVGRVALTNDLPDVSGYTTPADVTAAIREQSLGGIYDSELGIWWTPIMQNGALRYTATTNVNLNAEN